MEHKHEKAVVTKKGKTEESRDEKDLKVLGKVLKVLKELETESDSEATFLKKSVLYTISDLYEHVNKDQEEKVFEVLEKLFKLLRGLDNGIKWETSQRIRKVAGWARYL